MSTEDNDQGEVDAEFVAFPPDKRFVSIIVLNKMRFMCYYCKQKGSKKNYTFSTFYQKHKDCDENRCFHDTDKRNKIKPHWTVSSQGQHELFDVKVRAAGAVANPPIPYPVFEPNEELPSLPFVPPPALPPQEEEDDDDEQLGISEEEEEEASFTKKIAAANDCVKSNRKRSAGPDKSEDKIQNGNRQLRRSKRSKDVSFAVSSGTNNNKKSTTATTRSNRKALPRTIVTRKQKKTK